MASEKLNNSSQGISTLGVIGIIFAVFVVIFFFVFLLGGIIFPHYTPADINSVNSQVVNTLNQMFSSGENIAVYPESRQMTIAKGSSPPTGFAFSVYNQNNNQTTFTYAVSAQDTSTSNCGSTMTDQIANSYIISGRSGTFTLQAASALTQSEIPIILFSVPTDAPACTVTYNIDVYSNNQIYASSSMAVTFQ